MRRRPRRPKRQGPAEREGGRAVLLMVLLVMVMTSGGYVAAYAGADGKLPAGTRVGGVDVGGKEPEQAAGTLAAGLSRRLRAPMTLAVENQTYRVSAAQAGLSVDYLGSVQGALGRRSWDPDRLWNYYTGGRDYAPVMTVDESRMGTLLDRLDHKMGSAPRDGNISLTDGAITVTQPQPGATIDHPAAVQAIQQAWAEGRSEVALPLRITQPTVTSDQLQAAVQQLANPALAGPVTLVFDHSRATLTPRQYAPMLTIAPRGGRLVLDVVGSDLATLVDPAGHDTEPRDATVALADGAVHVVKAHSGHTFGQHEVVAAFLAAVDATGDQRTVKVQGDVRPATFTTRDAKALGVTTPVATYAVKVPASAGSALSAAAAKLSGTVLEPGQSLSFDQTVGDVGGLSSRLATATWNAGFLAGLTDVARTAPTTSTPASPAGRDVLVGSGVDLQMRNDTDHGVLLDARFAGGQVVVDVWSTPEYAVTATTGAPYNVVPRTTVTDTSPGCRAAAGADGYSVDLSRTWTDTADPAGSRADVVTTTYQPAPAIVCAAPAP